VLAGVSEGSVPFHHWTCRSQQIVATEQMQMPQAIVNSPYGGAGYVNSTWSDNPAWFSEGTGFPGVGAADGNISAAFVQVNVTVVSLANETAWGLGVGSRCTAPYQVVLPMLVSGGGYGGGIFNYAWEPLFGPEAPSDQNEPRMVNLTVYPGDASPYFSNGFTAANTQNVSTCGGPAQHLIVTSTFLTVWIPFTVEGSSHLIPLILPYLESFSYVFPANGIWAADNLSEPGGPGGGWAFDYLGGCACGGCH